MVIFPKMGGVVQKSNKKGRIIRPFLLSARNHNIRRNATGDKPAYAADNLTDCTAYKFTAQRNAYDRAHETGCE